MRVQGAPHRATRPAAASGRSAMPHRLPPDGPGSQLPARAGVSFKLGYFPAIIESPPNLGFFEVHAENTMMAGGPLPRMLDRLRRDYALSLHGVGLSIGGESPLDENHLDRLARSLERYEPQAFSEHLAWSGHDGHYLNDLLPLSYTPASLQRVCDHVDRVQERLGRRLWLENPATYVEFATSTLDEPAFVDSVVRRTGCGLLLDVNNVYVSCVNHHRDPLAYLAALPLAATEEIHLAGHHADFDDIGAPLLIDSHDAAVADAVWQLFRHVIDTIGARPTLIERDGKLPPWPQLLAEAQHADALLHVGQAS